MKLIYFAQRKSKTQFSAMNRKDLFQKMWHVFYRFLVASTKVLISAVNQHELATSDLKILFMAIDQNLWRL